MDEYVFIGRQPVLNRNQQIIGYELLYRDRADASVAVAADNLAADTQVLVNALTNLGTSWVLGDKLAFVNVSPALLNSDFLALMPPQRVVLEMPAAVAADRAIMTRLGQLREQGFGVCLDDFALIDDQVPLAQIVSYVKMDMQTLGATGVARLIAGLRAFPVSKLVKKVETRSEFEACLQSGADGFQGYYFARPTTLSAKVLNPGYVNIINLLGMVRNNDDVKVVEAALKKDVALSFKLLRYINSAGFGLSSEIQSFRHAVTLLGYKKLYRWLSLLLVTAGKDSTPPALMKTAVTRGRLAELLGLHYFDASDRDNLFVAGMFSLLDAMLDMPMQRIVEQLHMPEQINDALLHREGLYGPFLKLAESCERCGSVESAELARNLQLSSEQINLAHMGALAWVEELGI